jgi:hypothetical protein
MHKKFLRTFVIIGGLSCCLTCSIHAANQWDQETQLRSRLAECNQTYKAAKNVLDSTAGQYATMADNPARRRYAQEQMQKAEKEGREIQAKLNRK